MDLPISSPALGSAAEAGPIILALPKGRILAELGPLLGRAGIAPGRRLHRRGQPPPALRDRRPGARRGAGAALRRRHLRRPGAAQIGVCGADVLMEFDYPEIYAPLDLGIGHCRVSVAEPVGDRRPRRPQPLVARRGRHANTRTSRAAPLRRPRRAGGGGAPERRDGAGALAGPGAADRRPGADRHHAEGQRAGGDRGDRPGHLPPDRQPHRAEDPAGGDRRLDRPLPRGAGRAA